MMQQFATSSSKLAVASLSLDTNASKTFSNDSQGAIDDSRSAFDKAFIEAEQSAFVKSKNLADGSKFFDDQVHQQPVVREQRALSDARPSEVSAEDTSHTTDAKNEQHEEKSPELAILVSGEERGEELKSANGQTDTSGKNALQDDDMLSLQDGPQLTESPITNRENEVFDYINFVTEIQVLNDEVSQVSIEESESPTELFLGDELSPQVLDLIQNSANENEASSEQKDLEQLQDFANISLSEEELQLILDAQNAGVDLNDDLSAEQLAKLNELLGKMLNQFHPSEQNQDDIVVADEIAANSDESIQNDAQSQKELDLSLLKTLIAQGSANQANNGVSAPQSDEVLSDSALAALNKAQLDASKIDLEQDKLTNVDIKRREINVGSDLTGAGSVKPILDAQAASQNSAETAGDPFNDIDFREQALGKPVVSGEDASELTPNSPLNAGLVDAKQISAAEKTSLLQDKPQEKAQDTVKQLALLDERSQTDVLENIKLRAEKFVAELSGNASKGSEFVAAMQAGLKEFKEQLQSGREPGIDLKALVSDALSEINVEVLPRNNTKLDALNNQLNGLVGLANAVNQSSQSQYQPLSGAAESLISKESAVLSSEGTKLAQANLTAADKAINIFKQDGQQQLTEKVRWMINGRSPTAEIRLDPAELGSMQIKLSMTGDSANVSFTVQSPSAKEALDQAVPRLRDMLQEQGIDLGQTSVEQQSNGQAQQQQLAQDNDANANHSGTESADAEIENIDEQGVIEQRVAGSSLGGIDFYA